MARGAKFKSDKTWTIFHLSDTNGDEREGREAGRSLDELTDRVDNERGVTVGSERRRTLAHGEQL